jgi:uncharacterized protein
MMRTPHFPSVALALCALVWMLAIGGCKPAVATTTRATTTPTTTTTPTKKNQPASAAPGVPQSGLATGAVEIVTPAGVQRFDVDIAQTNAQRMTGLMHVEWMAPGRGMLFLFEREQQQSFWMKNTLLPLDMIFIRADMTILGVVENAEPKTLQSRKVDGASRYVLELNAGVAQQSGIAAGQSVRFVGDATAQWLKEHP